MKKNPLISVVMPTYNRAYIIAEAIDSIRNQTYSNWELVVIDDGSTDETKKIINSLKEKRIIYKFQSNQGPAAARNNALTSATGDWIAYLDSDNYFFRII